MSACNAILSVRLSLSLSNVSKQMDIVTLFDAVVGTRGIILVFLAPLPLQNSKVTPSAGALNTRELGKFLQILPYISETVRARAVVSRYYGTLIGSRRSPINPCRFH